MKTGNYGQKGMMHLNGHIACALDTETTGLRAGYHEMIQIALVPLGMDFEPDKHFEPFTVLIKPDHPNRMDSTAMRINGLREKCQEFGLDKEVAADLFMKWFDSLNLAKTMKEPFHKLLMPLCTNWKFDGSFIEDWLGLDDNHKAYMHDYFDYHVRDLAGAVLYINDVAHMHGEAIPFPKQNLGYICEKLKVDHPNKHDALGDAMAVVECYKRIIRMKLPVEGIDFGRI